ncbi:MAG TPA: ATP-binding cassette domain-containing protein [Flavisolibacter sp.]|jgi:ABC-type bacteriocin/lantibiotic exporter with double-glycine peptidase domain|nr:ATP-binding cassette domain-containing protein [Flavisolibacter sp.]
MAQTNPLVRIARLVREEKSEISSVYFFAILSSLIQLSLPLGIQAIIGFVLGGAMSTSLAVLIILVVVGVLTNGILQMNQMKVIERIQQKIFVRYSFAFANHMPRLDLQKIDSLYLPELVNRFFDIPVLQKSLSKILLDFPIAVTQIVLGLLLLSFYHPAFIFFGVLLLLLLTLIFYVTGDKGFQTSIEKSNYKYEVAGWLEEMARVIKQFKFSAHHSLHEKKADEKVVGYVKARKEHFSILLLQYKVLIGLKVIVTAAMLIVGCMLLLEQQINIGQFVAAEIVIIIVINSVEKLIVNLDSVYSTLTSVEKIDKLLDKPAEQEGTFTVDQKDAFSVEFRNVSFAYQEDRPILKNVSFSVRPGQKIAVTGKDGSGKSTILKLLTGAYQDFTGSVLVNEVPIGNYNLEYLRSHTGIMLNQQDLFAGTVWENIALGDEEADKAYISHVVQAISLSGYISNMREGYDTMLDPTGKRLPKNIAQKILLARALSHKPRLLLLEEPWQGIDDAVKKQIQHFLLNDVAATIIIATNDPDFIRQTDQTIAI